MKKWAVILLCDLLICSSSFCATTNKMSYGTNNQTLSIAQTVAVGGWSASASVDNTTNLFLDALVFCKYTTGSVANSTNTLNVFAYGTANGGTDYSDEVSGSSASITASVTSPTNLKLIGVIMSTGALQTYGGGPFSVASGFSGILPDHWGIVINNPTSSATSGAASGCWYQGLYVQNQ